MTEEGFDASTLVAWALSASPPKLAKEVVMRCIESVGGARTKAGVCDLRYGNEAERKMQTWMASWKADPSNTVLKHPVEDGRDMNNSAG